MQFLLFNVILFIAAVLAGPFLSWNPFLPRFNPADPYAQNMLRVLTVSPLRIHTFTIFRLYMLGLWTVLCVGVTYRFVQNPAVTWDAAYWIAAYLWCISRIMSLREFDAKAETAQVAKSALKGQFVAVIAAFATFAIWPHVAWVPYGWALRVIGLDSAFDPVHDKTRLPTVTVR